MFRNCFKEVALRQLKEKNYEEAFESLALCQQTKINLLLEANKNPENFELHWMLLGFSDSFIPILLKNKFSEKALETLILLGDAKQSMSILNTTKNPAVKYGKELEELGNICLESQNTSLFLQIQTLLGNKEKEVDYFIQHNMGKELSQFIRNNRFSSKDKPLFKKS